MSARWFDKSGNESASRPRVLSGLPGREYMPHMPPLQEHGAPDRRFVLPFCFKNNSGTRTTHHLVLVTKHFKGYDLMKGIMAQANI